MKTSASYPFRSAQAKTEYQALYMERAKAWPVASETRLVETPSGQTFVRVSGSPANPPLVLLHGARGNSLTWIPNITALAARYRTYALDTIGDTGLSVSQRALARPEHFVSWLDEVLAMLAREGTLSLAGLSYGGAIASQYAFRFPQRARKLVLLTPAATALPVSGAFLFRALLTLIPGMDFRRKFYHWLLHDTAQSGVSGRAWVDQAAADWEVAERCFGPLPAAPAPVLEDKAWQNFGVPTLFLVGENEKMYPAQKAVRRLNRVAPQIKTGIIPHAGHDLWIAQADVVTKKMLDFLCAD